MPPTQALVALHGFWIMVLFPVALLGSRYVSTTNLRRIGLALIAVGIAGALGIATYQQVNWVSDAPAERHAYVIQRTLFLLFTKADYPLIPITLTGLLCWAIALARRTTVAGGPLSKTSGAVT
jgi:hypothetical protein